MLLVEEKMLEYIIAGCKERDSTCQKQLYEIYGKRMTALCLRYCNDYETAKDLMHDGFIKVFSSISEYKGEGSFNAWIKKIFLNVALDNLKKNILKKNSVELSIVDNYISDENAEISQNIDTEHIFKAIQQLPQVARTIFNMFNIDGYSIDEICKKLNMSNIAVRTQHSRAKQKLREILKDYI